MTSSDSKNMIKFQDLEYIIEHIEPTKVICAIVCQCCSMAFWWISTRGDCVPCVHCPHCSVHHSFVHSPDVDLKSFILHNYKQSSLSVDETFVGFFTNILKIGISPTILLPKANTPEKCRWRKEYEK